MTPQPPNAVEVFYSYSHRDEELRDQLQNHLAMLKRQGIIKNWHDRGIAPGQEWGGEIDEHLNSADIILLLVSSDFLASDYCYDIEVKQAMERHEAKESRVIPIILRPCDWSAAPFCKLQALPKDARAVTSWPNRDEAFLSITKGIREAAQELLSTRAPRPTQPDNADKFPARSEIPRPPVVGFIARRDRDGRDIVERLREELAPRKDQLVVLWGAGGVGKTTLAAEAARSLVEDFAGRVVWVSADARTDLPFTTLLDEIARQLGDEDLRRLAPDQKAEAVAQLIAAAPTLIVLDNFETISPAEEELCKEFLSRRVRASVLITSRQRIDNLRAVPIDAMSRDEADKFLRRLIEQSPDRDIYAELDLGRIIETAEANPLIIEWIVGQIDLANDPEQVLTDLAHGEGDAAHRVFDRSFNLPQLNNGGRAVLLALSLFVPSASRVAVAAVANLDLSKKRDKERFKKAHETLASLWLLKKAEAGQRLAVAGLTRELTKARLTRDPRATTYRQRFVARFLHLAESNPRPTAEHLNALEAERDNVLSAMDVALETGDRESLLRIRTAMNEFLIIRGYWDEAIRSGEQALGVARTLSDEKWIAIIAHNVAITYQHRGEVSKARRLYAESLDIKKRLGDQKRAANTLHQLAMLAQDEGDIEEARKFYAESLDIEKRLSNQRGIGTTLHQLGSLAQAQGDLDEARRLYAESLDIKKRLGNQGGDATTLRAIGSLAQAQGDLDEARRLYAESLEIEKRLGDQSGIAASLHQLGTISFVEGEFGQADSLYSQSLASLRKLGHKKFIAECLESIGNLRVAQSKYTEARGLFDEALGLAEAVKDKFRIASIKRSLGLLAEKENEKARAAELLGEALRAFEELKSPKAEETRRDLERLEGKSQSQTGEEV